MTKVFTTIILVVMSIGLIVFIWSPYNTGTIGQYVPVIYRLGETIVSMIVIVLGIKLNVTDN